jgi:hypothetical protein
MSCRKAATSDSAEASISRWITNSGGGSAGCGPLFGRANVCSRPIRKFKARISRGKGSKRHFNAADSHRYGDHLKDLQASSRVVRNGAKRIAIPPAF